MSRPLRVLIVEDSEDDAVLILRELKRGGYEVLERRVDTAIAMEAALDCQPWDVVIADYSMPNFSATLALKLLQSKELDLPFIIVSGSIGETMAVAAMKAGAHDYLMKDNLARLVPVIERELREAAERQKRRQAEQLLRDSEERFRSLIENALDIIAILSLNGTIQYGSPSIQRVLGYDPAMLTGHKVQTYIHADDVEIVQNTFLRAMQTPGTAVKVEFRFRCQNGSWLTLEAVGKCYQDQSGASSVVINARDISDRKQAEEARAALVRERELHDLKSRFVSMVSHEFRTPLSVIVLSARLLERFSHITSLEKQQQYLERIQTAATRMTRLLDDVLFLGKAEADKLELHPLPLDLKQFCREMTEEVQLVANSQHQIVFSCQDAVVPACMDEVLLRHICINLLSNAIKYSPDANTVDFELSCEADDAILQIRDQGIGIPDADLKHLFESFHRGQNVGKIPGTGLGLVIVKQAVDLHQGEIRVDSQVGGGTRFTVRLPRYNRFPESKSESE